MSGVLSGGKKQCSLSLHHNYVGGVGWSGVEWRVSLKSSELRLSDTDSVSHEEEGGTFSVKG